MKQYMPLKPVKRRFKLWAMTDSLNGYVCDFDVYTGEREIALGDEVNGRHHQLFYDKSFSFISLLEKLLSQGTYTCGTIGSNRKSLLRSATRLKVPGWRKCFVRHRHDHVER